jgi:hypothetical protein
MTALECIETFLTTHQGLGFCDDCLSRRLSIKPRQAIQQKTSRLSCNPLYDRRVGLCSNCKETTKLVTKKKLVATA